MRIVVVGSSNTDMIVNVPKIPVAGETVLGGTFSRAAGGKGANQAVAAARAGGNVTFIARVGNDSFGEEAITGFAIDHIQTQYIFQDEKAPSGIAEIFVSDNGENCIAVAPGANALLSSEDVLKAKSEIASADVLVAQLETPLETVETAISIASQNRTKVILNPAPACELPDELLSRVSILTPNETETEFLTGIAITDLKSVEKASEALRQKGVQMVIITLGSKGVYVSTSEFGGLIPGYEVDAVDTTAAGDVFNGALAVGIAGRMMLNEAVQFAQAAAALSVTRMGAQPSCPTRKEILDFISQQQY